MIACMNANVRENPKAPFTASFILRLDMRVERVIQSTHAVWA
jgi:hypothetical protein